MRYLCLLSGISILLSAMALAEEKKTVAEEKKAERKLEYNRDIRPILAENCFTCHGPDSASRKGGLRLDEREQAIKKKAIIPGDLQGSELVTRLHSSDPDEIMPPPTSHKKLTEEQKKLLQQWIEQGAEYQPHWSLLAPHKPALPTVKNQGWVSNPIDAFVLEQL
ncbi:MAG TPA: hypothetical protein PKA06_15685, partial [Gemmatales bacterium]|nr:hypothetical protein [Gemmatales bacterium]